MCGIAGAYRLKQTASPADHGLEAAVACLAHRGPDDEGTYTKGNCALGHRRLSIIDTSSAGHQPFTDRNGRHTIIYNGEIFNFPELRRKLEDQGHEFRSRTDTELILRLFIMKGPAFLHDLNGFFALAIHDAETDRLFIARDRFGVKPLHWCEHDGRLLFASELRALEKLGLQAEVDRISLRSFFTHHYIPAPHSIYTNVQKLLPGHSITIDRNEMRIEKWYDLDDAIEKVRNIASPVQHVQQLLDDAVRIRLLSDVPVGTFLSGGLDSSIVSAIVKRYKPDLRTFSIGFTDRYFDESEHAEEVAKHIGSDHTSFILSENDLASHYEEFLSIIDEPFADSSALPSYLLCRSVREHVSVVLSGDGADEIFGGYRKHQAELHFRSPGWKERLAIAGSPLWKLLPRSRNSTFSDRVRQLHKFAALSGLSAEERYLQLASFEEKKEVDALIGKCADPKEWRRRRSELTTPFRNDASLNALLRADLHNVLPNDMLHKVDLTSMASGLEVRTPFLDHRLVAYAFSLPAELKFNAGSGKHLLRGAFGHLLPVSVLSRRKQGFEVPLLQLFLGPLSSTIEKILGPDELQEAGLDPAAVKRALERLRSASPGNAQATVHALLVYMTWWRKHRN